MTDIFTINADQADRYGNYVRSGHYDPYPDANQATELAWYAWQRGTTPVMAPPYVSRDRRVLSVSLGVSEGVLTARLDVVMPQPGHIRWLRSDDDRGHWRDWPRTMMGAHFYDPEPDDLARDPYLLCTASLRFAVAVGDLPQPDPDGADAETCRQAIAVLVPAFNAIAGPVIARIEAT